MNKNNPFGFVKDGKVFLKSFMHFPERQIGEVRDNEEASLQYFIERFQMAEDKVAELEHLIASQTNKGSFLMKLLHLKEYLAQFDAIGDFTPLFERLETQERMLNEMIEVNRVRNQEIKKALLLEMEQAVQIPDWRESTEKVLDIKNRWIKTGSVGKGLQEEMEGRFTELMQGFFDRKKAFFEDLQRLNEQKAVYYQEIIEKATVLSREHDKLAAFAQLKELQKQWKEGPEIPGKMKKELFAKFKRPSDYVYSNYKRQLTAKAPGSAEDVLSVKKDLLDKVRKLAERNDAGVVNEVKRLQEQWRSAGIAPRHLHESLNDEFFVACDFVTEQQFLHRLAYGKNKDFDTKPDAEKVKIKIRLIKDLLSRDERDLEAFTENMEKLNSDKSSFDKLMHGKLNMQKRKVKVKQMILEALNLQLGALNN
ncbi:DUF349 domain-containing protein [Cytophagales bacterium LB-30]|uniref:DUF349 domain-containing protein n=1 Tax=Shiella aurantiaca TaxID=3058365 RepID=A0ABT8F386_9BACT|nr:DUF349 domain-containing protein [Shiella aurantiaca]MDN4164843.1 DUF349 domain-containing protein [Shiella aurantiaca]